MKTALPHTQTENAETTTNKAIALSKKESQMKSDATTRNRKSVGALGALAALAIVSAFPMTGKAVSLNTETDSLLDSFYTSSSFNPYYSTDAFSAGTTTPPPPTSSETFRTVIRFDLTSISPGTQVLSATLRLAAFPLNTGDIATLNFYRVTNYWTRANSGGHALATWNDRTLADQWTTPGGDHAASASATASGTFEVNSVRTDYTFSSLSNPQLLADVQSWVNNPSSNYGWIMINDGGAVKSFYNSQGTAAAGVDLTPYLDIEVIPEPSTVMLLGLGGLMLFRLRHGFGRRSAS